MKNYRSLYLFALLFTLYSCSNAVYEEHQDVREVLAWDKTDIKTFKANIQNPDEYNVILALRHHSQTKGPTIPIEVQITGPDGNTATNQINFVVRDANGDLVGSAAGDICDTEMTIMPMQPFAKAVGRFGSVRRAAVQLQR